MNDAIQWYSEVSAASSDSIKVFVGSKIDLRKANSQHGQFIDRDTARSEIREKFDCSYVECSSIQMEGIADAFNKAIGNRQGIRTTQQGKNN